jgi:hypothetical protein
MSYRLSCHTLFDITQTGVINRNKPGVDEDMKIWLYRRNTQCNLDTILQAISLRSQPEIQGPPQKLLSVKASTLNFGEMVAKKGRSFDLWTFEFDIQHPSVFDDGISELGSLYHDCDQVPMILTDTVWGTLPDHLDTSPELRNIYFKVLHENN